MTRHSFSWPPPPKEHSDPVRVSRGSSACVSPRKNVSSPKAMTKIGDKADMSRFELFDSKAEIKYTPEDDDLAASIYADRKSTKPTEKKQKPRTSGYDFDNYLKGKKIEYNPWG